MAQQTLTLLSQLITGTVALVGGLSGAGITAYINRLNTIDTLTATAAAKDIEYADLREREHDSWLRNQRQEAYAEFLSVAQSVIEAAERDIEGKLGEHKLDDIPVLLARLRLVVRPLLFSGPKASSSQLDLSSRSGSRWTLLATRRYTTAMIPGWR